jgi:hypothetical protein
MDVHPFPPSRAAFPRRRNGVAIDSGGAPIRGTRAAIDGRRPRHCSAKRVSRKRIRQGGETRLGGPVIAGAPQAHQTSPRVAAHSSYDVEASFCITLSATSDATCVTESELDCICTTPNGQATIPRCATVGGGKRACIQAGGLCDAVPCCENSVCVTGSDGAPRCQSVFASTSGQRPKKKKRGSRFSPNPAQVRVVAREGFEPSTFGL